MRIVFTGGGSGGHFYPILAIVQALRKKLQEEKLVNVDLYFFAPGPYNKGLLYDYGVKFKRITSGKRRLYFSLANFTDYFKIAVGTLQALWALLIYYPDAVVGKGGYASFPTLLAARILRIPVMIHESDTVPGRVNRWAGKFAKRIAVSFPEAAKYFDESKVAYTGNPLRKEFLEEGGESAERVFNLEPRTPLVVVLGGSQGAQMINNVIVEALPRLLRRFQVIHQTGREHLSDVEALTGVVLRDSKATDMRSRYHPQAFLSTKELKAASGRADIVISRAGSTIFEIAAWGIPSVIVPISESNGDHQRKNAYAYARAGAAIVMEERNFNTNILTSELERLMDDPDLRKRMSSAAKGFAKLDAADKIAAEAVKILLSHVE